MLIIAAGCRATVEQIVQGPQQRGDSADDLNGRTAAVQPVFDTPLSPGRLPSNACINGCMTSAARSYLLHARCRRFQARVNPTIGRYTINWEVHM